MIILSYASLINSKIVSPSPRPQYLLVEKNFFQSCMRNMIEQIPMNEAWYIEKYPDIAEGINKNLISSAREHYVTFGYFENRIPFPIAVDGPWYLKQYPDVDQAVQRKEFESAQDHFEIVGFGEGRFPYKSFALVGS